jgi:magnesium-transporting ATPase (P-type)
LAVASTPASFLSSRTLYVFLVTGHPQIIKGIQKGNKYRNNSKTTEDNNNNNKTATATTTTTKQQQQQQQQEQEQEQQEQTERKEGTESHKEGTKRSSSQIKHIWRVGMKQNFKPALVAAFLLCCAIRTYFFQKGYVFLIERHFIILCEMVHVFVSFKHTIPSDKMV